MRIPKVMNEFAPAKLQGGTLVHAKHIRHDKALCGRTITNWLESPGTPEWYLCLDGTDLTCPECRRLCGEQNVELTPDDVDRIFRLAGCADSEGLLDAEDRPMLRKLRDAYPGVAEHYRSLFGDNA